MIELMQKKIALLAACLTPAVLLLHACTSKKPDAQVRVLVKKHESLRLQALEYYDELQGLLNKDALLQSTEFKYDIMATSDIYYRTIMPIYVDGNLRSLFSPYNAKIKDTERVLADSDFELYAISVGFAELEHRLRKFERYKILITRLERNRHLSFEDEHMLWALGSEAFLLLRRNDSDPSDQVDDVIRQLKKEVEDIRDWFEQSPTGLTFTEFVVPDLSPSFGVQND